MITDFFTTIFRNRYVMRSMITRDLKARYVGSFLGIFWSIIHPLSQVAIYYFIFSIILNTKLGPEYNNTGFAAWLVAGLLPWLFFAEVVARSPQAILDQASLLTKVVFPVEILALIDIGAALINHLLALSIFSLFLVTLGDGVSLSILYIVPALGLLIFLILGISWLLSALNVFFRDIGQITGVIVNIWFFLTPVIYPQQMVPEHLQFIYQLNPILHIVELYRLALLGNAPVEMYGSIYLGAVCLIMLAVGGLTFKKLKPVINDEL